jgi:hypothetical protein
VTKLGWMPGSLPGTLSSAGCTCVALSDPSASIPGSRFFGVSCRSDRSVESVDDRTGLACDPQEPLPEEFDRFFVVRELLGVFINGRFEGLMACRLMQGLRQARDIPQLLDFLNDLHLCLASRSSAAAASFVVSQVRRILGEQGASRHGETNGYDTDRTPQSD